MVRSDKDQSSTDLTTMPSYFKMFANLITAKAEGADKVGEIFIFSKIFYFLLRISLDVDAMILMSVS